MQTETRLQPVPFTALVARLKAAGIHLLISAFIVCSALLIMVSMWYPGPLFFAAGGNHLVMILALVDIVVGPCLTLLVFDKKKKYLKLDLAAIGLLQVAALAYGGNTIFEARPVYVVFVKDQFELVRAPDIYPASLAHATRQEHKALPKTGPTWVSVAFPTDPQEQVRVIDLALQGSDIYTQPQYYVSVAESHNAISAKAQPLTYLLQRDERTLGILNASLAKANLKQDEVGYLPLNAREEPLTVLVRRRTGEIVDTVRIDPW